MEHNGLRYQEYRAWPIVGCQATIDTLGWALFPAVSRELHESTTGWIKHPAKCASTIIVLSIISLREGFLPDYLQRLLGEIRDISDLLDDEELACYRDDLRTLAILMERVPYKIIDTGHDWDGIEDSIPAEIRSQRPNRAGR